MKIFRLAYLFAFITFIVQFFCIKTSDKSLLTFNLNKINGMYKSNNYKTRMLDDHLTKFFGDSSIIYGNSSDLNYYYVNIYIGNPPQKQAVIIDTGSHITAVPCQPYCKSCGKHINEYYNSTNSNVSRLLECGSDDCGLFKNARCMESKCYYSSSYGEGSSLAGYMMEDNILFGDTFETFKSAQLPIGCTITETKLFYNQLADGIMGLGPGQSSFVSLLYNKRIITHNVFSLCFAPNGGYFSAGGVNTTLHKGDIQYINFSADGFYKVKLKYVLVEDKDFSMTKYNYYTIIDSGTTLSYFPANLYNEMEKQINVECSKIDKCLGDSFTSQIGMCFKKKENISFARFLESLPTMTFIFENDTKYYWKPENYIYNYTETNSNDNRSTHCIGLSSWYSDEILLGSTFMHNHDIIFDLQENKIGLVEANCGFEIENKVAPISSDEPEIKLPSASDVMDDWDKTTKTDVDFYTKLTIIVSVIAVFVIILLVLLINKLRRGAIFNWSQVNDEEAHNNRVLTFHEMNFTNRTKDLEPTAA